jgi:hypothetical protein
LYKLTNPARQEEETHKPPKGGLRSEKMEMELREENIPDY